MPQHTLEFSSAGDPTPASQTLPSPAHSLSLAVTDDAHALDLRGVQRIHLNFPKFTDGRAYSQAVALRRRGFSGALVATGDVVADQALQLARCGFSHAQLRADQSIATAQRQLGWFADLPVYYQPSPGALPGPLCATQPSQPAPLAPP